MEFFENAVNKAKDVFDVVVTKTEEAVTTGKQKLDIATLENKLAKDFERLGRAYFETIKDTDDIDTKFANIKDSIVEKQTQISKIKEEMGK